MSSFLTCQVKRISVGAGLPNVASTNSLEGLSFNPMPQGALNVSAYTGGKGGWAAGGGTVYYWTLNASRFNSIYGSSGTVTPLSQSTLYILKY